MALGHPERTAKILELSTGKVVLALPRRRLGRGVLAPVASAPPQLLTGRQVISSSHADSSRPLSLLNASAPTSCDAAEDGVHVACGRKSGWIDIWDVGLQKRLWTIRAHDGEVATIAVSARANRVATGGRDHSVRLWDLETGDPQQTLAGHKTGLQAALFLNDNRLLSADMDGTLKVWELGSNQQQDIEVRLGSRRHSCVCFDEDGKQLAVAGIQGPTVTLDVDTGRIAAKIGKSSWVRHALFRPGQTDPRGEIAYAYQATVAVFSPEKADPRLTLTASHTVWSIAYNPQGTRLAGCDNTGHIHCWDAEDGTLHWRQRIGKEQLTAIVASPDGRWLATVNVAGALALVDIKNGKQLWLSSGPTPLHHVVFHPDGTRIYTGGDDGSVREHSIIDGKLLRTLVGLSGAATALAWTPNGKRLFVGYSTGTVKLWSKDGEELLSTQVLDGAIRSIAVGRGGDLTAIAGDTPILKVWKLPPPKNH